MSGRGEENTDKDGKAATTNLLAHNNRRLTMDFSLYVPARGIGLFKRYVYACLLLEFPTVVLPLIATEEAFVSHLFMHVS